MRPPFVDPKRRIERRLFDINERLQKMRTELGVIEEQLAELSDQADEAKTRAVVAETAMAEHEFQDARRHAEQMSRARDAVRQEITELEAKLDELIGRLVP